MVPADAVRTLQSIARRDASEDDLWSTPEVTTPNALDPVTIREQFHRDHRGVQAITAWLSQGGPTPELFAILNSLMAEDEEVEPILTGLINTSMLLVHLAAGAVGPSPEGLVGGLLDIYGQFDQPGTDASQENAPPSDDTPARA